MIDPTWIPGAAASGFGSDHLPYGRVRRGSSTALATRVGDHLIDLAGVSVGTRWEGLLGRPDLTVLLDSGPETWSAVREWLRMLVTDPAQRPLTEAHLSPLADADLVLPLEIGDYTDFYASEHHAANVGRMYRPDSPPLLPNWKHLPISYHGRAGTVIPSGSHIPRPQGQFLEAPGGDPVFGLTRKLDIEAELGFVVGGASRRGHPVPIAECERHLFGVVGLNDWSARDIQAWEYVPLGPNLGKSFATSISAWITPWECLKHARIPLPAQDPVPLPHLWAGTLTGLDIKVSIVINGETVSTPPYATMYWSPTQMLAHLTSNGASIRSGDLFGSGTISGSERDQRGSLLELSWNGTQPWGRSARTFLEDGDEVVLEYVCDGEFGPITLGEVRGRIESGSVSRSES